MSQNNVYSSFSMIDSVTSKLMDMYSVAPYKDFYPHFKHSVGDRATRFVYRDVYPQTDAGYGKTVNFLIPRQADFIGKIHLFLEISAGGGATAPSLKQDVTSLIERASIFYAGNLIQVLAYNDSQYCRAMSDDFERASINVDRRGISTLANRQILAQTNQEYQIQLESTFLDHLNFPVSLLGSDDLRLEIVFRKKDQVTQAAANYNLLTGLDITQCFLRIKYAYIDKEILQSIAKLSVSNLGIFMPFIDVGHHRAIFSAGLLELKTLLSNNKGLVSWGCWMLRRQSDVDNNNGSTAAEFTNTYPWKDFSLTDSSVRIYPGESQIECTYLQNRFLRHEDLGAYVQPSLTNQIVDYRGFFSFGKEQLGHNDNQDNSEVSSTGYYNFSASQSIYLNISLNVAANEPLYLDVYTYHYNALNLKNGTLRAYSLH